MSQIKEITTSVSKKIGQPNFGSASVLASITSTIDEGDDVDMVYSANWGYCWDQVDAQEKELVKRTPHTDTEWLDKEPVVQAPPAQSIPVCQIHNKPMTLKPAGVSKTTGKPYPAFWSCSERMPDGSFCKFKPTK